MAWTQADLDNVEAAIASGELIVSYSGPPFRTVTYRSTSDLIRARDLIKGALTPATERTPRFSLAGHSRG